MDQDALTATVVGHWGLRVYSLEVSLRVLFVQEHLTEWVILDAFLNCSGPRITIPLVYRTWGDLWHVKQMLVVDWAKLLCSGQVPSEETLSPVKRTSSSFPISVKIRITSEVSCRLRFFQRPIVKWLCGCDLINVSQVSKLLPFAALIRP